MFKNRSRIILVALLAISLMIAGCSIVNPFLSEEGEQGNEQGNEQGDMVYAGGLSDEEGQTIDDDGLVPFIVNTAWELLSTRELDALTPADVDSPAVIDFKDDGSFSVETGCGQLSGTYTVDGNTIAFEVMMTTSVYGCSELQVQQALAVENLVQNATGYIVDGEELIIAIDGDNDAAFKLK